MERETIQCLKDRAIQCPLDFFWVAETTNGDYVLQYDEQGEHLFKEVQELEEQEKLSRFYLVDCNGTDRTFSVQLGNGRRLIHFRRNFLNIELATGNQTHQLAYAMGYQRTVERSETDEPVNEKTITFITPEGDIISEQELYDKRGDANAE